MGGAAIEYGVRMRAAEDARAVPVRRNPSAHQWTINIRAFADVTHTIDAKDRAAFTTAYKASLDACYSCHKSSGKPYPRPMIPTAPPQTIINDDPKATWPQ